MAITDYIPNIFGAAAPSSYESLLGMGLLTPEQVQKQQNVANIQGLLGAGLSLAQGMGRTGPRRSAAENILGALTGGFGAAGGAYQQGLQNVVQQQQIGLQARQMAGIQSMKMKYPDLADEFDANPSGAFRLVAEREALAKKPTALSAGQTLVSPTGQVIYQSPQDKKKNTVVVDGVVLDLDTGQPIYTAPPKPSDRKTQVVGNSIVDVGTGEVIFSAPEVSKGVVVGGNLVNPSTGEIIFSSPEKPSERKTAIVNGVLVDASTGEVIYQGQEKPSERKTVVVNGVLVDTQTGEPIYGTPTKQAPEVRDFADGTTRMWDLASQSYKIVARKPQGEGKSMYASTATPDPTTGRLVFLPTRPGLPVVDAATGKPVDYVAKAAAKPMPATLQKAEEEDYDLGQAAINLANDSQKYLNSINKGTIKFGIGTKLGLKAMSLAGSNDPDVIARNEFERFKTTLINESLRLNKGTQTEGDAVRAAKELQGAESAADAGKAIQTLRDINVRRAEDYQKSIIRRRTNAKAGDPEINLEVPKFDPYVFTKSDFDNLKSGQTYIYTDGKRYIKK